MIRNNIFGFYSRHGISFWQETDNPKLGSSDNKILHNLFISTGRQAVQFINHSTRNEFANNVILGVRLSGANVTANPAATLMEVDGTVVHGLEMLLHQAVLQVRIFTSGDPFQALPDEAAVLDVMRRAL